MWLCNFFLSFSAPNSTFGPRFGICFWNLDRESILDIFFGGELKRSLVEFYPFIIGIWNLMRVTFLLLCILCSVLDDKRGSNRIFTVLKGTFFGYSFEIFVSLLLILIR